MESNFCDWARKNGLKQETIDKRTEEDLNDFPALQQVDIPACNKHLRLSLGQAAILENDVTLQEDDMEIKRDRNDADEIALFDVKTLTRQQTADEYVRLKDVCRSSALKQNESITKADTSGKRVDISQGPLSQQNLASSLTIGKTTVDGRDSPVKMEQSVFSEKNVEETVGVGNPTFDTIYLIENTKKQSPLQRQGGKKCNAPRSDRNPQIGTLGFTDEGQAEENGEPNWEINLKYHIVREDNKVQLVTELSTEHVTSAPCVPISIVLLLDRSGSMLHFFEHSRQHTKITQVKWLTRQLIQNLDIGDEVGIVIFGTDAEIFYPLTKITDNSRKKMLAEIETLDSGRMCSETNLSAGLRMALKVYNDARKNPDELLNRKNSILIFSDGEVNAGTTNPDSLVHEVRHNIRQMAPSLDDSTKQWVTISVVTTGSAVSDAAYLLSKTCSSDAYFYVDNAVTDSTFAEVFLPVLLRKSAVTWNVSLHIQTFNGICFVDEECTRDYKIRLRRKTPINTEKAYFLYDFPAGKRRQIGITVDISNIPLSNDDKTNDRKLFQIRLEYTGRGGERRKVEKCFYQQDIEKSNEDALCASVKHKVQLTTNEILRRAADYVKDGDDRASVVLRDGKTTIQRICDRFGQIACSDTVKHYVYVHADYVVKNMEILMNNIEGHLKNKGPAWNRIKAVSSAITREAPTLSMMVKHSDVLCPLPVIAKKSSLCFLDPMKKPKEKRFSMDEESKPDLEALIDDMERTLQ